MGGNSLPVASIVDDLGFLMQVADFIIAKHPAPINPIELQNLVDCVIVNFPNVPHVQNS